ncbi:MAG: LamG domain-containing protein, partial [bacterium]|nr:LamG domain-containing protein [bacterium]
MRDDGKIRYQTKNGRTVSTAGGVMSARAWRHVAVTFDEQAVPNLRIYVDGIEQGNGTADLPAMLDTTLLLGRKGGGTAQYFKGKLDEVRLYNTVLSGTEVAALASVTPSAMTAAPATSALAEPSAASDEALLSGSVQDTLVLLDGQTLTVNVAESAALNYGVGDFTVLARISESADLTLEFAADALSAEDLVQAADPAWSHIAAGVRDGDQLLLYLNGDLQAQQTIGDKTVTSLTFSISLTDPNAVATIDDVQLFDTALSPAELAEAAAPLPGDALSLSKGEAGVSSLTTEA